MTSTDAAAWWGAIVASLVFIWDIYKWIKSGTALRISAVPNMQLLYDKIPKPTDTMYVHVDVSNTGDKKTTITHLVGVCHTSFWKWLFRRKPGINFFVPAGGHGVRSQQKYRDTSHISSKNTGTHPIFLDKKVFVL